MNDSLKFVQDRTVPPAAFYFFPHNRKGLLRRQAFFVRPLGSKRVINIRDFKDAGGEWNLFPSQPVRVPGAVALFVVVANDRQHVAEGWVCDLQVELKPRDVPPSNLQTRH